MRPVRLQHRGQMEGEGGQSPERSLSCYDWKKDALQRGICSGSDHVA